MAATLLLGSLVSATSAATSGISAAGYLAAQGVITAAQDSSAYRLEDTITRKEMMKIVMNLSGKASPDTCESVFDDVVNDWGCKYIEAALKNNFIAQNANFRPDESITKAESIKLVLKARGIDKAYNSSDWQGDYMRTALDNGLLDASYSDHNSSATRGWIFSLSATSISSQSDVSVGEVPQEIVQEAGGVQDVEGTQQEPAVLSTPGVYTDYDSALLGQTENTVLFFHASWCPSCRAADAALLNEDFAQSDITLLKVDFDTARDLRKKYGVTGQHTFVQVDKDGELITKWSGGTNLDGIIDKLK